MKFSFSGLSFFELSFPKPAPQNIFDPVDFHRDIRRRKSGDFADRAGVHLFEIANDDLPVDRLQPLDQRRKAFERLRLAGGEFDVVAARHGFDVLNVHQPVPEAALANHVAGGYVMSHAVDPGSQRTSLVEIGEAAPEMKMDFLQQIAARLGIKLIRPRQPVERGAVSQCSLLVQRILIYLFAGYDFSSSHR